MYLSSAVCSTAGLPPDAGQTPAVTMTVHEPPRKFNEGYQCVFFCKLHTGGGATVDEAASRLGGLSPWICGMPVGGATVHSAAGHPWSFLQTSRH